MELFFLLLLILFMMGALMSGYPVGLALPGAAILSIGLAGASGWLFESNVDAYFAQGGPTQWLSAGVTNLRSLYWEVERDTLIAIPLFIFMGIMLQRSRIAEDLLIAMARMFGSLPGGLGISVVIVGALLAATTGIVGATVIAMGLISLPAMQKNNYSVQLSTGTICASGTLGQIIPPSIVLIILADQLANAADIASTTRKTMYRDATGEFGMPSELDVASVSAGDMFMGALIPGLILVSIYVVYILVYALLKPENAPPIKKEGNFGRGFAAQIALALIPPLVLILTVLGSIIAGIATVNQAGAIGAAGAIIMAGYRLSSGRWTYFPAFIALISVVVILYVTQAYDINVRDFGRENGGPLALALVSSTGLVVALVWSLIRTYKIDNTLREVMEETTKTTSMVFVILLGAAMLTSAFRAFGGEELIREFLTGLPGGFWIQFVVVMIVIFCLGFFLDFIEIAVVVVPIVAPILLANPEANITAVWLGVMIGLNIQTSYLTPPFGFALFYLRGVAPAVIKTVEIYKGAAVFVGLQLLGLAIVGLSPPLVNFLPNLMTLTSEISPPPVNPRLQQCLERHVFDLYESEGDALETMIVASEKWDLSNIPTSNADRLRRALALAAQVPSLSREVQSAALALQNDEEEFRPIHDQLRAAQKNVSRIEGQIEVEKQMLNRTAHLDKPEDEIARIERLLENLEAELVDAKSGISDAWIADQAQYAKLVSTHKKAQLNYRRSADESYQGILDIKTLVAESLSLANLAPDVARLAESIRTLDPEAANDQIKQVESTLSQFSGTSGVRTLLSKSRRALRGDNPDLELANTHLATAVDLFQEDLTWRTQAEDDLLPNLTALETAMRTTIGARLQPRLSFDQAWSISSCKSVHRNIDLSF